eukprot:CCRYP_013203-RA/>CCRYP_013203-RA protein AED:0.27 eAED:0.27 QI:0/0/0/1/0/0/2/0/89
MLFDVPFVADWSKIGEYRQKQTDKNTHGKMLPPSDQVLLRKDGILCKTKSRYESDPWAIMSVHTNGTISVQHGTKPERLNIRRVTPYFA